MSPNQEIFSQLSFGNLWLYLLGEVDIHYSKIKCLLVFILSGATLSWLCVLSAQVLRHEMFQLC